MLGGGQRWGDVSSVADGVKAQECPSSPCSTAAPSDFPQAVRWADLESDSEDHVGELEHSKAFENSISEDRVEAPANASRPMFARMSRKQRLQQIRKAMDEFLSLEFDAVSPEEQGGLAQRMLATAKSLATKDVYWNAEGDRVEEERYEFLGLQEADMYAIGQHVKKAVKYCEKRSFRKVYDTLCQVRPWIHGGDLSALRADWESKSQAKEAKKQKKQRDEDKEEAEGWQIAGVKSKKEATSKKEAKSEASDREKRMTDWEVAGGSKKKSIAEHSAASNFSQHRLPKHDDVGSEVGVKAAKHGKNKGDMDARPQSDKSKQETVRRKGNTQCQFTIGIEEEPSFKVMRKILGPRGQNMKHIAEETGAKLRLRGRGSGFLEGPDEQESTDPLMLCVSAPDVAAYEVAHGLVSDLLEDIYEEYRMHCRKAGRTVPNLSLNVHEGYRQGRR